MNSLYALAMCGIYVFMKLRNQWFPKVKVRNRNGVTVKDRKNKLLNENKLI